MSLLDALKALIDDDEGFIHGDGLTTTRGQLADPPQKTGIMPAGPTAGNRYVRVKLVEARLQSSRFVAWNLQPAVQSVVTVLVDRKPVAIARTIGPSTFASFGKGNFKITSHDNVRLCSWLPYPGGVVGVSLAMFAIPDADDGLKGVIKVLGTVSDLVMVPAITTVINIAEKVAEGAESLVADKPQGVLAIDINRADGEVTAQHIIAIAAKSDQNDIARYSYRDSQLYFDNSPAEDVGYLLIELEVRTEIEDEWTEIPSIAQPYELGIAKLYEGDRVAGAALMYAACAAALVSDDLPFRDRQRVVSSIKTAWDAASTDAPPEAAKLRDIIDRPELPALSAESQGILDSLITEITAS